MAISSMIEQNNGKVIFCRDLQGCPRPNCAVRKIEEIRIAL